MMRTSTLIVLLLPIGSNSCSCNTRSSFTCVSSGSSPTSSRKMVPPSATLKRPSRFASAPVNAPLTWPNNSLSTKPALMAPQFTFTSARRTDDERGGIGGRDLVHLSQHIEERRAAADYFAEVVFAADFLLEISVLRFEPCLLPLHQH